MSNPERCIPILASIDLAEKPLLYREQLSFIGEVVTSRRGVRRYGLADRQAPGACHSGDSPLDFRAMPAELAAGPMPPLAER